MPRLPHPIPVRLGFSVNVGSSAASYTDTGVNYDYAIGGLAFISAATPQDPSQRKTAQFQKQQFDNSNEPGDHTLNQWWTVGQSSFHAGAGQLYIDTPDPDTDRTRRLRYQSSVGIDPWTSGQVSLLKQVTEAATSSSANCQLVTTTIGANNYIVYADGSVLKRLVEVGTTNPTYTSTTFTVSGLGTILALATDGINYWVADSTGIWKGDIASTGAGVKQYTAPAGTSLMRLAWMKQRLMVGLTASAGAFIYQLTSTPAGPPVTLTTVVGVANGAPAFVHPVLTWQWTALAEGPEAIYAAGYAGSSSAIFRMVLDTTGNVPLLGVGITAADFPPGELVTSMVGYLGAELGISTTAGIRIAQFGDAGTLSVGRISAPTIPGQPVSSGCAGLDRFIFAGYTHSDGVAGLMRVDPSQALAQRQFSYVPEQQYAYATDLRAADTNELDKIGVTSSVGVVGASRVAFAVASVGIYVQSPNRYRPTGTLTTSRIRYDTTDPKVFRYVRLHIESQDNTVADGGLLVVSVSSDAATPTLVGTFAVPTVSDTGDLACNANKGIHATVIITLSRAASANLSPLLMNYQIKALPAQRRQRNVVLQLSCFDHETDNTGQEIGGDGTARSRLLALEQLEQNSDFATLQYLGSRPDQQLSNLVVIDEIVFTQSSRPTDVQGWGGIIQVTCRTVDA